MEYILNKQGLQTLWGQIRLLIGSALQGHDNCKHSNEEVDTGKKWIDGKPIYRQVFTINEVFGSFNGIAQSNLGTISNLDIPINIYGVLGQTIDDESNEIRFWRPVGMRSSINDMWNGVQIGNDGVITVFSGNFPVSTGYVVVEYTKATDAAADTE